MIKEFIEATMEKINTIKQAYYEEAPTSAIFPYLVVPTLNIIPLNAGYSTLVDIEIHCDSNSEIDIEDLLDTLKNELDGYTYNSKEVSFYFGFDSVYSGKATDQDLTYRKITFEARIF